MQIKINGNAPFQVNATNFSISPSAEGYTLQISADGVNFSDLFAVGAGVTRMVTGVASGSYYRCNGNQSEIQINWVKQCSDGQGGGSGDGVSSINGQRGALNIKTINGNDLLGTGNIDIEGGKQYFTPVDTLPSSAEEKGTTVYLKEYQGGTPGGFVEAQPTEEEGYEGLFFEPQPNTSIPFTVWYEQLVEVEVGQEMPYNIDIQRNGILDDLVIVQLSYNGKTINFSTIVFEPGKVKVSDGTNELTIDSYDSKAFEIDGRTISIDNYDTLTISNIDGMVLSEKNEVVTVGYMDEANTVVTLSYDADGNLIVPEGFEYFEEENVYASETYSASIFPTGHEMVYEVTDGAEGWETKAGIFSEWGIQYIEAAPIPIYFVSPGDDRTYEEGYYKWNGWEWEKNRSLEVQNVTKDMYDMLPWEQQHDPYIIYNIIG